VPPFRAIAVFFHVARHNSIVAAAAELNVTPSAVSQQIKSLEEQVGTKLVSRNGRSIRLTEAGERYFELIAEKVEGILHATEMMHGARRTSDVVIRTSPTIATKWLLPRLSRFRALVPDTNIRIDGSNEPVDFSRDNVDLEIRHGSGGWPGLYSEPLTEERFLPVCAPALAGPGSLTPKEVLDHPMIRSVKAQVQWTDWTDAQHLKAPIRNSVLSFDRSHMAVDAAALGLGIALESELMMEAELRSAQLVIPVARTPRLSVTTQWLVCPRANLRRSKVTRLFEWLRQEASEWREASPANSIDFL